ncbi:hypothetical protein GDO86_001620, partial [Hymenochirus boettgeri]
VSCKEDVKQKPDSASAMEGDIFTMTCEYESNLYGLHWYKQIDGEKLHFLRIQRGDDKIQEGRFVFQLQKEKKLSSLSITHLDVSDTATYWCALEAQC